MTWTDAPDETASDLYIMYKKICLPLASCIILWQHRESWVSKGNHIFPYDLVDVNVYDRNIHLRCTLGHNTWYTCDVWHISTGMTEDCMFCTFNAGYEEFSS